MRATRPRDDDGFLDGMRTITPLIVAVLPIGMVFGSVAATKGLSPLEATLMSAFVFAGGSQFVAMDIWTDPASWSAVGVAALLVNIRHVLMSASLGRRLQRFSPAARGVAMLFLADEIWAMAEARSRLAPLTVRWFAGLVVPFYAAWVLSTLLGATLGAFLGDPKAVGLDFAFPAVFVVLVMGFWKDRQTGVVLAASAVAALVVQRLVPGVWYIAAGAAAGLVVSAFQTTGEEALAS
ncbi:4-azaleucine resistance transporter AzlC [Rhizobium sp. PP-F2F-G48]|nr:4-azaleucine resistance transporter AzlC [Rhizobium sp. PP-F2F-G48]